MLNAISATEVPLLRVKVSILLFSGSSPLSEAGNLKYKLRTGESTLALHSEHAQG